MKKMLKKPAKKQPKTVLYQEALGGKCNCGCEHGAQVPNYTITQSIQQYE